MTETRKHAHKTEVTGEPKKPKRSLKEPAGVSKVTLEQATAAARPVKEKEKEKVLAPEARRGRPQTLGAAWSKVTVVMMDENIAKLDRLTIDYRLKTGKAVSRAEIIRGLIETTSEDDMVKILNSSRQP